MPRLRFVKQGRAIWISHLDLMRVFQRAFKRAGLPLKHTQGFNPRPSVSIALPMSVGVSSQCELLDFDLEGMTLPSDEITQRLNDALIEGVEVLNTYEGGQKVKHIGFLDCSVTLQYDGGVNCDAVEKITALFARSELLVEKQGKNGVVLRDIIPMIRHVSVSAAGKNEIVILARICCQEPSLNPAQLVAAVEKELPELKPDCVNYERIEIYDREENLFQ